MSNTNRRRLGIQPYASGRPLLERGYDSAQRLTEAEAIAIKLLADRKPRRKRAEPSIRRFAWQDEETTT